VLALAHELFELAEASGLGIDDQATATKLLAILLDGSRLGYGKVELGALSRMSPPSTPANHAKGRVI